MKKTKVKSYFDNLMTNKEFRKKFYREYHYFSDIEHGYKKLGTLSIKEKGKEKAVTKKFINNLKKGRA